MDHRQRLELLALRLGLYGEADPRAIKSLARGPLWLETRTLLRSYGFAESDIAELTGAHPKGCPCWACVWKLNRAALSHQRRLRRKLGRRSDIAR